MTSATVCSTPSISRQAPEKQCLFKLLIFSEDRSLCRVYSEAALALGYSATIAWNGEQVFYKIGSDDIDVVLLDINPPVARV